VSALETERHALHDLTSSLSHLQTSLAKVKEQSAVVEAELAAVRKEVTGEKAEKERQENVLKEMRGQDGVELGGLEEIVGWRVEGVKRESLSPR
jgi:kinetochore protein Spc25